MGWGEERGEELREELLRVLLKTEKLEGVAVLDSDKQLLVGHSVTHRLVKDLVVAEINCAGGQRMEEDGDGKGSELRFCS